MLTRERRQMEAGSLAAKYTDRANPLDKTITLMADVVGVGQGPFAAQIFGNVRLLLTAKVKLTMRYREVTSTANDTELLGSTLVRSPPRTTNIPPTTLVRPSYTLHDDLC